jgi:hypothetical protein
VSERFGNALWQEVSDELRGLGLAWWRENQEELIELSRDEAEEIFTDLRQGRTVEAKLGMVANMSRAEWSAYRDGTTARLGEVAVRRAKLFDALGDLGIKAAKAVGEAALRRLGS